MKINNRTVAPWMAAILCFSTAPWAKATDPAEAPKTSTDEESTYESEMTDEESPVESQTTEEAPAKFNKASGIVGMEVRNQDNERLGRIKDLVFDLKTERVSYAVLAAAPKSLLSLKEKLLAVPLSAFTASSDSKHLILNADKSKIEMAEGFDAEHWPSVDNPSWGAEPFWKAKSSKSDDSSTAPNEMNEEDTSDLEPGIPSESEMDVPATPEEPEAKPDSDPDPDSDAD